MPTNRYVKIVLTVIAVELLWLSLRDMAPPVAAQAVPTPVIITGVQLDGDSGFLPIGIAGSFRELPAAYRSSLQTTQVQITGAVAIEARSPLKVETERPLKIEADRPLPVQTVPYRPTPRPGG